MKKIILLGSLFITVISFGQTELDENKYYAKNETVFLKSQVFDTIRELQIFLPDQYFKNPEEKFKVLYVFDAQIQPVFNNVSGNVQLLASMHSIEPLILVGVVTYDRWYEFLTPNNHDETLVKYQPPMGSASLLLEHIENEVEPYIKQNYRVQDYRLGIGHSLGGTFLTYANMESNILFDYSIILSPNYAYDKEQFIDRFKKFVASELVKPKKLFFAIGHGDSYEERFKPPLQKAIELFKHNGNPKLKWDYEKLNIDKHNYIWFEGVYKGLLNWK